jgi:hypothetical protein
MTKKEYTVKIGISISLFILGFILLAVAAILQNNERTQPWVYSTLGFSFFPLCLISIYILLKNRKEIKNYEDNKKMEKGKEIIESKDETLTNLNAMLGNTKKYSFILPLVAGVVLLTLWGYLPDLMMGNKLEEFDMFAIMFVILTSGASSFGLYRSYQRRIEYLELYDKDKEALKQELYSIKDKQNKSNRYSESTDIGNVDSLLIGLGDKLLQGSDDPETILLNHLRKTYGLKKFKNLWFFLPPQVFGLVFVVFDGGLSVLSEGSFWFTYIGANIVFGTIYVMFKISQREGKYIMENYKHNREATIQLLEDKRLLNLGSKSKLNPQMNTLRYDIILYLLNRIDDKGR